MTLEKKGTGPEAVLFDMDGSLIDSRPAWTRAELSLAHRHGFSWTARDAYTVYGWPQAKTAAYLSRAGMPGKPREIIDALLDRVREEFTLCCPWMPGAQRLLCQLADARIPTALVSSSYRRLLTPVLADSPCPFAFSIGGDEVAHPKPSPEPYLIAARAMGVDISRCVVVEDSRNGLASAVASGARVVGVGVAADLRAWAHGHGVVLRAGVDELSLSDLCDIGPVD